MNSFHRNPSHFPPYHEEAIPYLPQPPQQPIQSPLEPSNDLTSKLSEFHDRLDTLGSSFASLAKTFNRVENPYPKTDRGDFSFVILLVTSWIKELHDDKEMWEHDPYVCNMVAKTFNIFNESHSGILKL